MNRDLKTETKRTVPTNGTSSRAFSTLSGPSLTESILEKSSPVSKWVSLRAKTHAWMGVHAYKNGSYDSSVKHYSKAVELDPTNPSAKEWKLGQANALSTLATSYHHRSITGRWKLYEEISQVTAEVDLAWSKRALLKAIEFARNELDNFTNKEAERTVLRAEIKRMEAVLVQAPKGEAKA